MPIKVAVGQATKNAPVRVFTLGIGGTTSSALCEGMARAGNGICLMATTTETIIGKCSRLVRASRTYILKNVSIDWGLHSTFAPTALDDNPALRQAPRIVSAIYPGTRFVVFALIEDRTFKPPREVVIRAQRDGQGDLLQFTVPVQLVDFPPEYQRQPLIQTLAARRAIMDLDDSASYSPDNALIVRLGTQYQLASKFTSFIAVDKRTRAEVRGPTYEIAPIQPRFGGALFGASQSSRAPQTAALFGQSSSSFAPPPTTLFGQPQSQPHRSGFFGVASPAVYGFGSFAQSAAPVPSASTAVGFQAFGQVNSSRQSASTFSPSTIKQADASQAEDLMDVSEADPMDTTEDTLSPSEGARSGARPAEDVVTQLILLQSFDGSFPPDNKLLALLGGTISFADATPLGVSERIWATCLAVAYLKLHMKSQPELLDSLVEKAKIFISQTPGADIDKLFARAQSIVSS